jgi:pimeloyl-ACP methyl ester carboxylesterase
VDLPADPGDVSEIDGAWRHRYVSANGARFHLAEAGEASAPLVLLLHGFPEFWWTWRHLLSVLPAAGFRAAALDLRGYGGSDKTPRGYDPVTLAQDVSGVVKALGARSAVLVGHGWGGYVGWATAVLYPAEVTALCAVSAPHPRTMLRVLPPGGTLKALAHVLRAQLPLWPERRLANPASGYLRHHLIAWSAAASGFPDDEAVRVYQAAMRLWPSPHCALEYHRWLFRSRFRSDGRRFDRALRAPLTQPVCVVAGDRDPALRASAGPRSAAHVQGGFTSKMIAGVGHFPHEERPDEFAELVLSWLESVRAIVSPH